MDLISAFTGKPIPKEAAFPEAEYRERLAKVRTAMAEAGLDLLLLHHMPNICYLSGYQTPMADWYNCLIVPAKGDLTLQACDIGLAVVHSHTVKHLAWVRWDVMSNRAADQTIQLLGDYDLAGKRVGLDLRRPGLGPLAYDRIRSAFPRTEFTDATDLVLKLRSVKSPAEIECLREAARISSAGMKAALAAVEAGVTENTIAAACIEGLVQAGSEFFSIDPFIRTGHRSAMTHANFKRAQVRSGDTIILEIGGVFQRYTAPLYRTAVVGKPSERVKRLTAAALATLALLYENVRAGRTMDDVARAAARRLESVEPDADYNENHAYSVGVGFPPDWVEHSVFIRPGSMDVLRPGMTFHTPRSFRVPGECSVGFSETILVTETGCEPLTQHPRELFVA